MKMDMRVNQTARTSAKTDDSTSKNIITTMHPQLTASGALKRAHSVLEPM